MAAARWRRRALLLLAPVGAVLFGCGLLLADPPWLQVLRHAVFDQYQRWAPRAAAPAPVLVVDIDEESLARIGQWPWPRTRLAQMVEQLQAGRAAAIGFDVLFAEPDRTSPAAMAALWPLAPRERAVLAALPDHDAVFAAAIGRGGVVLGLALTTAGTEAAPASAASASASATATATATAAAAPASPAAAAPVAVASAPGVPAPAADPPYRFVQMGEPAARFVHGFSAVVAPLPVLAAAAAGSGALSFVPDHDGVVRRVPLLLRAGDTLVPTLVAELLRVGQGERNYVLRSAPAGAGLAELRIGQIALPTTSAGELWVHYTPPRAERSVPAWKLLAGALPAAALEGRLVLVGSSAQGLMDLRFSPLGGVIPGVQVHAQALEQILSGQGLQRPPWAQGLEALALAIGGIALGSLALALGALPAAAAAVLAILGVLWAGWTAFSSHGLLLDPVTPALGLLLAYLSASVVRHAASERRQRWLRQAFARYVSPNRVAHLVAHPDELALGGQRRSCSFVFTDLAGFTSLMEKSDPAAAVSLLNAYLDEMVAIAFRHQGTLDRIIGDAVAIMFSAPAPQPDHCRRALDCALEMQRFASGYAQAQRARGVAFGDTRIGVHTGEVIVGNFGGSTMFDYRALGDPVNTASRLEGANRYLGTLVCVSAATLAGCPDAPARPIGRVLLKGKTEALAIFEPVDAVSPGYLAAFALLAAGAANDAQAAFARLAESHPEDRVVQMQLERLQAGARDDLIVLGDK